MTRIEDREHFESVDATVAQLRNSIESVPTLFKDSLQLALSLSGSAHRSGDLPLQTVAYFAVFGMTIFNRIELERLKAE